MGKTIEHCHAAFIDSSNLIRVMSLRDRQVLFCHSWNKGKEGKDLKWSIRCFHVLEVKYVNLSVNCYQTNSVPLYTTISFLRSDHWFTSPCVGLPFPQKSSYEQDWFRVLPTYLGYLKTIGIPHYPNAGGFLIIFSAQYKIWYTGIVVLVWTWPGAKF